MRFFAKILTYSHDNLVIDKTEETKVFSELEDSSYNSAHTKTYLHQSYAGMLGISFSQQWRWKTKL